MNYKIGLVALIFFTGCLDINIKSVLPKENVYNIDNLDLSNRICKAPREIGLGGINSANFIDSRSMVQKLSDGQINTIEDATWIDNPKNMIQTLLAKQAQNACIHLTQSNQTKKVLFIDIFFIGFKDGSPQIELGYKITDQNQKILEIGQIVKNKTNIQPEIKPKIKNLQKLANEAVLDILRIAQ